MESVREAKYFRRDARAASRLGDGGGEAEDRSAESGAPGTTAVSFGEDVDPSMSELRFFELGSSGQSR